MLRNCDTICNVILGKVSKNRNTQNHRLLAKPISGLGVASLTSRFDFETITVTDDASK
jgi:hypothetical protein